MSDIDRRVAAPRGGWVGPIVFAAVVMMVIGVMHGFEGIVALLNDDYYLVPKNGLAIHINYTGWGWSHLIVGTAVLVAGFCVLLGQVWARVVGVILAVLSILMNMAFLAASPGWTTIMIALDVLVIWALTFHGRDVRPRH
ncbi:DUF7144 family membrane protein [Kribbella pratensis]|jgi:hypothetical protein|uniref:DUF7144 domain-containing protein n=1 Tax=Kribbella pratensis TaxID=2512112 RepID=A0A4R8CMF9_9ACTN|nr:hypothetical protein [Kribbella pratensis]TDW77235.1 hypothetical protein EV653_2400 [Kribbella pratensis]